MKFEPVLTQEEFEGLHAAVDSVRKSASQVKVDKKALEHLLMDQSKLWAIVGEP